MQLLICKLQISQRNTAQCPLLILQRRRGYINGFSIFFFQINCSASLIYLHQSSPKTKQNNQPKTNNINERPQTISNPYFLIDSNTSIEQWRCQSKRRWGELTKQRTNNLLTECCKQLSTWPVWLKVTFPSINILCYHGPTESSSPTVLYSYLSLNDLYPGNYLFYFQILLFAINYIIADEKLITGTVTSQKSTQLVTDGNTRDIYRFDYSQIRFAPKFKAVDISQSTLHCILWIETKKKSKKEN